MWKRHQDDFCWEFSYLCALTTLLSVRVLERVRDALRHKQDDEVTAELLPRCRWSWVCCWWFSPRHLSDRLNQTWRSLQEVKQHSQQQHGRARTNKQTKTDGDGCIDGGQLHIAIQLVFSSQLWPQSPLWVCWWQQSPFFPRAQCEHCETNMTLRFLQRLSQSAVCIYLRFLRKHQQACTDSLNKTIMSHSGIYYLSLHSENSAAL